MAQRFVGPSDIVIDAPSFDRISSFGEGQEYVFVDAFVSKSTVEAFDEGVLRRLSWRNIVQLDLSFCGPCKHRKTGHLGAIIHHDGFWISAIERDALQNVRHAKPADRCVDFNRERFAREVVDDRQRANTARILERVVNEVEGPSFVRR